MSESRHYCHTCGTHFGGPPNYVTPEEHANIAHDGVAFEGIENGDWRDYERQQQFRYGGEGSAT